MLEPEELPDDLPENPTLSALAMLIGEKLTLRLAAQKYGQRLYIPKKVNATSPIARTIGEAALAKVVGVYGGLMMEVPTSIGRRAAVASMILDGREFNDIVKEVYCSRRFVTKVNKELENGGLQELFEPVDTSDPNQLKLPF